MSLHKADGSQIAVARQERQTVLDAEIPEDGEYVLQVEDLLVGGGADHVYRIDVSDAYAGFTLNAEQTQYTAPQAGTFVVKVLAQRRGYNGPIELAVEGLGDGVKLEGQTFEGAETLLKITLPADIPAGEIRHATIVGKAKIGEETVTVPANQREPLLGNVPECAVASDDPGDQQSPSAWARLSPVLRLDRGRARTSISRSLSARRRSTSRSIGRTKRSKTRSRSPSRDCRRASRPKSRRSRMA